ncbi:MAG TPA: peptidoglycan DD-metalloendopeptidase family protein [Xanthomonadaceae bacterium]|nr:peptidoglycan DD-metalloendopeptidase family protein [Xanthomonadaceae bacterium]
MPAARRSWPALLLGVLGVLAAGAGRAESAADPALEQAQAQQRLEAVRVQIRAIGEEVRALESQRGEATESVRAADRAVAQAANGLHGIEQRIAAHDARLAELTTEREREAQALAAQRQALAQLLRSAYALGRQHRLKLVLAQDRLDQAARALAYHRYFERAQVERIEGLLEELRRLAELGEAIAARRLELEAEQQRQRAAVADLQDEHARRAALLAEIDTRYSDRRERLAALGRDEKALVDLLERLRDVFADIPDQLDGAQPFAQLRGKLPRPLPGRLQVGYGGRLPDGRGSNGWLIPAAAGTEVRAIAHGRVAFADWLRGYGLIAIVDHGEGWMSLYAHADALLKSVGDWVAPGEALATVGSSGGQGEAALYFELRRGGRAVDPAGWLGSR